MKDARKHDRLVSLIGRLCAEYFSRESETKSLLTITNVALSVDGKYATILFTVFPEETEQSVLLIVKRKAGEARRFIEEHTRVGHVPFLSFKLDRGEKNRQKIEEISKL